jgi:hypothetical protein
MEHIHHVVCVCVCVCVCLCVSVVFVECVWREGGGWVGWGGEGGLV